MRWPVFAFFAFVCVVAQLSLRNVLTLESLGFVTPDIVACLAVFVALFAHRTSALWACWGLGLAMDLAPQLTRDGGHVIGPNALGYVFGGYMVLQLRTMVFRRRAVTLGFLTFVFVLAASVVAVALLTVRGWYAADNPMTSGALEEFMRRSGIALYSGIIAIPLGWLLGGTIRLWGFQSGMSRRTGSWAAMSDRG